MDISDDKMNVYKDLARKCESFELFKCAEDLKETTIEAAHPQLDEEITTDLKGMFL